MTFEDTKRARNMYYIFCSLIYYERYEKFFVAFFHRQNIICSEFNQSRAKETQK